MTLTFNCQNLRTNSAAVMHRSMEITPPGGCLLRKGKTHPSKK